MQNFTLLTSHIDHRKMYNLTSHFSYHISRFTFQIPHLHTYLTFYSLYLVVWSVICEVGNVKWESQITTPRCQMWFVKQTWNVNSIFGKMRSSVQCCFHVIDTVVSRQHILWRILLAWLIMELKWCQMIVPPPATYCFNDEDAILHAEADILKMGILVWVPLPTSQMPHAKWDVSIHNPHFPLPHKWDVGKFQDLTFYT